MLGQVAAEGIDQLRALANQEITGAKQHGARLLLLGLDRHEAHGRPDRRLTNGFCVRRVVLLAPDERFDINRRNQSNFMAESTDGASPVMGAPAGLHSDDAAWMLGQKSEDFIARKLLAERHAAVRAGAMRLKGPLCKVETNDANFFHGCPLHSWDAQNIATLAHCDAVRRGHPLHQSDPAFLRPPARALAARGRRRSS